MNQNITAPDTSFAALDDMSAFKRMALALTTNDAVALGDLAANDERWEVRAAALANDNIPLAAIEYRLYAQDGETDSDVVKAGEDALARRTYFIGWEQELPAAA